MRKKKEEITQEVIETVEETKTEIVEEPKNEVVETTAEEVKTEVVDQPQPQEQIKEDFNYGEEKFDAIITLKTFKEFYSDGGFWDKVKTTAILCAVMVLILYLFRNKEQTWGQFGIDCLIYCGIIILWQVSFNLITYFITCPKQYKKLELEKVKLNMSVGEDGIEQEIDGHRAQLFWHQISVGRETEDSFLFTCVDRRGYIFSKDGLSQENIEKISRICKTKLISFKSKK